MFDNTEQTRLFQPLILPSGQVIANCIATASTEESLAGDRHLSGTALLGLCRRWGEGGAV